MTSSSMHFKCFFCKIVCDDVSMLPSCSEAIRLWSDILSLGGLLGQGRPYRVWSFLRSFSLLGGSNHPPRLAQLGCCVRRPGLLCSLLVLLLKYVSHHV